jgi:hypothetical protein
VRDAGRTPCRFTLALAHAARRRLPGRLHGLPLFDAVLLLLVALLAAGLSPSSRPAIGRWPTVRAGSASVSAFASASAFSATVMANC